MGLFLVGYAGVMEDSAWGCLAKKWRILQSTHRRDHPLVLRI
jgi:hypothetical protein